MNQPSPRVFVHVIFSTKDRYPFLGDAGVRSGMHSYLADILKGLNVKPFKIEGTSKRVHLRFSLSRTIVVSDLVNELRRGSSAWVKERGIKKFSWQNGHGVFSVVLSKNPQGKSYLDSQEERNRVLRFKREYRSFLEKHQLEYDDSYQWD